MMSGRQVMITTIVVTAMVLGFLYGWLFLTTQDDVPRENTEQTRIEACSSIEDEPLMALCINGLAS